MTRALIVTVVAGAFAVTACSGFRPRVRTTTDRPGVFDGRSRDPGSTGEIGGRGLPASRPEAGTPSTIAGADSRRICRTSSRPDGWIAVAYVAGDGCGARGSADSSYVIAVLAQYAILPVDAELDVCADERIPRNWVPSDAAAAPSDACPGVKGNSASTTRSIRRRR
jgi:hypothetical protein